MGGTGRLGNTYTLLMLYVTLIMNENILCGPQGTLLCSGDLNGKEVQKGGDGCVCLAGSVSSTVETSTTL